MNMALSKTGFNRNVVNVLDTETGDIVKMSCGMASSCTNNFTVIHTTCGMCHATGDSFVCKSLGFGYSRKDGLVYWKGYAYPYSWNVQRFYIHKDKLYVNVSRDGKLWVSLSMVINGKGIAKQRRHNGNLKNRMWGVLGYEPHKGIKIFSERVKGKPMSCGDFIRRYFM